MSIKVKFKKEWIEKFFKKEWIEKFYPGGLEAWKKGEGMVHNLISQQKIEQDFQKAIKEKREKRLKKHAKKIRELRSEGFTMEKIDRFEEDE